MDKLLAPLTLPERITLACRLQHACGYARGIYVESGRAEHAALFGDLLEVATDAEAAALGVHPSQTREGRARDAVMRAVFGG